eukprot:CAMPEP_0206016038 /NCGR_PEP_ID=MMETSP1464-20131121/21757_1 /ASSEMBLY_ACC=CAM_ASM_001124 /TAXON_ID=119497 /ORGANISM="Exanthemachrysis gayraliae, Strain RCC1523" /LENGTH=132 /DNA_ID=CAMNT_0053389843 /DNA_START=333 /DNA_END=728 /DNA_ORIENTATION=+
MWQLVVDRLMAPSRSVCARAPEARARVPSPRSLEAHLGGGGEGGPAERAPGLQALHAGAAHAVPAGEQHRLRAPVLADLASERLLEVRQLFGLLLDDGAQLGDALAVQDGPEVGKAEAQLHRGGGPERLPRI